MKVGIVTFIDYENYGNRLQNYALQCLLESYGCEVETILHEKYYDYKYTKKAIIYFPVHMLKSVYWWFYERMNHDRHDMRCISEMDTLSKARVCRNIEFSEKYIKESSRCLHEGNIREKDFSQYDLVVAGSDQIWNPDMAFCMDLYMLQYVPFEKRTSFAASIGVEKIPRQMERQWAKYVNDMKYVSVREPSGKQLLSKYLDKEIEVLLDPTLLVETSVWDKVREESNILLPERYIATYILGDVADEELYLEGLASDMGVPIVRLNDKNYEDYYTYDVSDFIRCISSAEVVITDSFHAAVFSIIYRKEFYVLKRKGEFEGIYSRLTDLLEKFNLSECQIDSIKQLEDVGQKQYMYNGVDIVLEEEKIKADFYLKKILGRT